MSLLPTVGAIDQDTGFYNGVVQNSLRMNGSDATLSRTLVNSSDGSRQKNVWSFWVKFGLDSSPNQYFYSKGDNVPHADTFVITITSNNRLQVQGMVDDGETHNVITTRQFRDSTAWYHIVVAVDTTQTTNSNKICIYVNGVKETAFDGTPSYPGTNALLAMNWYVGDSIIEMIGDYRAAPHADYKINGCIAEYHSVDGLSFFSNTSGAANSSFNINSFGEFKEGIWIPVAYTGSHGTQGYHLKFNNESVGTGASDTVGADSAGSNHWTSTEILTTDCNNFDCPENNVCVMNSIDRRFGNVAGVSGSTTNGLLLSSTSSTSNTTHHFGTHTINEVASQGGVYFEFRVVTLDPSRFYIGLVATSSFVNNSANAATMATYDFPLNVQLAVAANYIYINGVSTDFRTGNTVFAAGEVGGMAILSNGKVFIHREGTYLKDTSGNVGNPSTGANPITTIDLTTYKWQPCFGYADSASHFNFGQDPTFDGNESEPDPVKRDANGIGKFLFDVPTNCLALCSSNMEDPTIIESKKHFGVVAYDGNGSNNAVSGVGFRPDWIWSKDRNGTENHIWLDSTRGNTHRLSSNNTDNETTDSNVTLAESDSGQFAQSDGFTLTQYHDSNLSSSTNVACCWKANGGTTTTNDASATSIGNVDSVIQANTDAGFSIVTYTGQNAATTVAHGLGKKPAMVIVKQRTDDSTEWIIGHQELATNSFDNNKFYKFDTTASVFANSLVFGTTPTTTEIALTTGTAANLTAASKNFVMYCFAEIDGFSKFGSYNGIGDDNNDGVFVFTGFKPAFVMIRRVGGAASNWLIMDNARSPRNIGLTANCLAADQTHTEATISTRGIDFVANGFKIRTAAADMDGAGFDYIYMAFAEQPFKYANAR